MEVRVRTRTVAGAGQLLATLLAAMGVRERSTTAVPAAFGMLGGSMPPRPMPVKSPDAPGVE